MGSPPLGSQRILVLLGLVVEVLEQLSDNAMLEVPCLGRAVGRGGGVLERQRVAIRLEVDGVESLHDQRLPVLFATKHHQSHFFEEGFQWVGCACTWDVAARCRGCCQGEHLAGLVCREFELDGSCGDMGHEVAGICKAPEANVEILGWADYQ
eukprot:807323-Pelagomonas_calceolata.AAC.2